MEIKRAGRYLFLKEKHPTMIKLDKLAAFADELGITLSFGHDYCEVNDKDRDPNLPELYIIDIDNEDSIHEWPPTFEFKVRCDNPKYLEERRKEEEEYHRTRFEREKALEEERKKKAAEAAAAKQRAIEMAERAELARLKSKYGE